MKVLVTDGNNRAALAITRSLGRKGHLVLVGAVRHPSLASSSKYCHDRFVYPSPTEHTVEFVECLIEVVRAKKIDIILPVSDVTTIPVTKHKKILEQYCTVPFPEETAVKLAANKAQLFQVAEELGVAVPRTLLIENSTQPFVLPQEMSFPLVVKPCTSRILTDNGWISTIVKYAKDWEELKRITKGEHPLAYPLLLQERIVGPGVGVFACYNRGKPVAYFSHRRLREKPPSGGVSVLRESIPVSPVAKEFSERLLKHLKWHGVAMVEFKLDNRDNVPKLMEVNGRFWGSLQLAIDAGVDFPNLLLDMAEQKTVGVVKDYKIGVKTRWLLGDLDSLLLILFKSKEKLNLPVGHQGKTRCFLDFMKLWGVNTHYEVLSLDDIKPWLYEVHQWLRG